MDETGHSGYIRRQDNQHQSLSKQGRRIMNEKAYKQGILIATACFLAVFIFYTMPYAIELADPIAVSLAGFANPISSGWATDVISTWFILAFWIFFEAKQYGVKRGWVCLPLGIFPGVAFGFCLYLLIRHKQIETRAVK